MKGCSSQSGSSSNAITSGNNGENRTNLSENQILLKLEEDGFITPDDKVEKLLKSLTKPKCLHALIILFQNIQNEFSSQALIDALVALANPTPFNYYSKESVARLELHLRTWVTVLEQICFSEMRLSRELREDVYNSLAKFAEIHRKTTQVIEGGLENIFKSNLNINQQQKNDENYIKKRNYNIDFLLIHLRDTLHSLHDDETWFREILRRVKVILKAALGITPGILSATTGGISINDNSSILTMLSNLRQGLSFKYPVASYYVDWRIMLLIHHNINKWSLNSEKIISKKFGEMILMEYFWSYVEREWIGLSDKAMLDSQTKFDELSNKVIKALKNTESLLNDLAGNEPLALPHTLWFGILDLAHNLIQKSTRTATYGLCYYLAIESLNRSPSSFIQFKSIEILLHLHSINNELFSIIDLDFDQYIKRLNENNSLNNSSKKFQNLLTFVKEKYLKDLEIINDDLGKGKEKCSIQKLCLKRKQKNSNNILDCIVSEIKCPITYEPADQLCILECQHVISSDNFKKLKRAKCPICQQKFLDDNVRYLSQNTIYKNLYSQFFEAGHISSSIETENSDQLIRNDQYNINSDESEDDMILTKKRKLIKIIKRPKSNISLYSIFQQVKQIGNKKQHPTFHKTLEELRGKNYEKAVLGCKEFLTIFPKSYSMRCILAYIYRCLNKYEDAVFYLKEAIYLRETKPIAWYIYGEILFRQNDYENAITHLETSEDYNSKTNNLHILLGSSYLYQAVYNDIHYDHALNNFNIALQNDPNNYLCLKYCAYIYGIRQIEYSNALNSLDKLLSINKKDSLVLCFYGEILFNLRKYDEAISYFTKANDIDPENTHILSKRAITYCYLKKYKESLMDINQAIKLDPLNDLLFYIRCKIYIKFDNFHKALLDFNKSIVFLHYEGEKFLKKTFYFWLYLYSNRNHCNISIKKPFNFRILDYFNRYMYKAKMVYYMSNLDEINYNIQEDKDSITGKAVHFGDYHEEIMLHKLQNVWEDSDYYIVWKIWINNPLSNSFIKFRIKSWIWYSNITYQQQEHQLESSDLLKLPRFKWFEYILPFTINTHGLQWIQPSIEIDGIDMRVDYVRFISNSQDLKDSTCLKNKILCRFPNIPEAFEKRYFLKKEVENLLELKDIHSIDP